MVLLHSFSAFDYYSIRDYILLIVYKVCRKFIQLLALFIWLYMELENYWNLRATLSFKNIINIFFQK